MVSVSIDNTPVSVQLGTEGDSVTVPSGEVWKVILYTHRGPTVRLNGTRCMTESHGKRELILVSGDTVKMSYTDGDNENAFLTGFKLNA